MDKDKTSKSKSKKESMSSLLRPGDKIYSNKGSLKFVVKKKGKKNPAFHVSPPIQAPIKKTKKKTTSVCRHKNKK